MHSFLRDHSTFFAANSTARCTRSAHVLATFTKLKSGSWRVQVRQKGKYVNETFLRRKDAELWALEVEYRIDRGEPAMAQSSRDAKTIGDLIKLHREDLQEVGRRIGRSKSASLTLLEHRLGRFRISVLDRERHSEKRAHTKAQVQSYAGACRESAPSRTRPQGCSTLYSESI